MFHAFGLFLFQVISLAEFIGYPSVFEVKLAVMVTYITMDFAGVAKRKNI